MVGRLWFYRANLGIDKSTWLKYYELGLEDPSGEGREDPGLVEFIRQRQELFRDYETQRLEPTLYDMLHEPEHSRVSRLDLSQLAPGNPRRFQQACVDFEDALLTLPNVQRLSVFLSTDFRWHGHCFFESDDSVRVEERAAPLAFVLRALGERSVYSNSVVSIDLKHCEPQWGLQDLDRAWWPRDTARPIEIPAPLITSLSRALMEDAFIHLTELRLESYINDDTFEALGRLVEKTTKLVRLTVWNNSMRKLYWPADMLNRTNNGAQWPMLEELSLQNFLFTTDTLLRTISPVAPTLKSLEVQRCRLVGAESTWPGCFRQMRLLPLNGLCRLDFQRGSQHAEEPDVADTLSKPPQAWSHRDVNNRLLVLYRTGYHYVGFSSQIYDYILKKTDDMPALRLFNEKSREALDWSRRDIHGRFRSSCDALALE